MCLCTEEVICYRTDEERWRRKKLKTNRTKRREVRKKKGRKEGKKEIKNGRSRSKTTRRQKR